MPGRISPFVRSRTPHFYDWTVAAVLPGVLARSTLMFQRFGLTTFWSSNCTGRGGYRGSRGGFRLTLPIQKSIDARHEAENVK